MEILTISGGSGLFGEVRIPGAKNSVLPIMAASVLCRGTVTLTDVPHLSDVGASARILQSVGCKVLLENGRAVITPPEFPGSAVPEPLMRAMRSSLFYLAPLLARTGRADIYTPGGCRLGARPIDMHLSGLEKMGAHITEKDGGALEVTAPDGLAGADICLRFPSVGATETLLMAAAAARGETVLRGAAVEPEVTDLARFLQGAGADITGVGTRVLHIRGRELLMGTRHAVCPDRITAATVLCAVAGCGGEVLLTNTCNAHLATVLLYFDEESQQMLPAEQISTSELYNASLRNVSTLVSRDLDGDGIVEIPTQPDEAGLLNLSQSRRMDFIVWMDYTSPEPEKSFGLLDEESSCYIELPAEWEGNLMLTDSAEGEEAVELHTVDEGKLVLTMRLVPSSESAAGWTRLGVVASRQMQAKFGPDVVLKDQSYRLSRSLYRLN